MVRNQSRRRKREQTYPYISVEGVDNRLLDWILVNSTSEEMHDKAITRDKMLHRKIRAEEDESKNSKMELYYAEEMSTHYNFYNALANLAMEDLLEDFEQEIEKIEKSPTFEKAIESVMDPFIGQMITMLRFYKKGRYAEKYIPAIIAHDEFTRWIDTPTMIVYEQLEAGHSFDAIHRAFEQYDDLVIEEDDVILVDEEIETKTPAYFKNRIADLLEEFEVVCSEVDITKNLELQEEIADQQRTIAELEKQSKSKDTQISRLQKGQSKLEKSEQAIQAKFDEAKKQDGLKALQIGELRKELEAAQKAETSLTSQVTRLQNDQDKVVQQLEQTLSNKHRNELAHIQDTLSSDVLSLTTVNEQLTSELKKERDLSIELEESTEKLKSFQTEVMNRNHLLEQKNAEQALAIAQLQEDKENLQRELANIRAAVTGTAVTPIAAPQRKQAAATVPDIVSIPDDLMDDLMIAVNKPVETAREEEADVGQVASIQQDQEDEDEFDIFSLTENKPE